MNRRHPNEHSSSQNVTSGTVCAQDLADILVADGAIYQEFADWLDSDLERLEARFADYSTTQSLGLPKGRHSNI